MEPDIMALYLARALDNIISAKTLHERMVEPRDDKEKSELLNALDGSFDHVSEHIAELIVLTTVMSFELPHFGIGVASMPIPGRSKNRAN